MDEEDYFKIKPIAIFVSLFYTKVFLWSRIAGFSHIDDLVFIGAMTWYKNGCKEIADAAILSCKRYFWYLTEELVVLFIFNEKLPDFPRFLLAQTLFHINSLFACGEKRKTGGELG